MRKSFTIDMLFEKMGYPSLKYERKDLTLMDKLCSGTEFVTTKYVSLAIRVTLVWLILRNSRYRLSSENGQVTFVVEIFTFVRKISICKGTSLSVPGRRGWLKSLETLISAEGQDWNLHNSLTTVYCAFPDNLTNLTPPPTAAYSFVLNWRLYLRWWLQSFGKVTQFSCVSRMCTGGIHITKLFPPVNPSFITGMAKPEPRRVLQKLFFLPCSSKTMCTHES